jgi:5-methylthioribose kinase
LFELTPSNAAGYLTSRGLPAPDAVTELGGGVSNTVLLVETGGGRMVLKQSLGKLRVEQDWFSDRERIFREAEAMRALAPHLPTGGVPEILFEDRANCTFAMSAAPAGAKTWKARLMAGEVRAETAARIGEMLAAMVHSSWENADYAAGFGDQTVFDQLRLDPYYRSTARRHPDLAPRFARLMKESGARRVSLVHGDWSPKNFLVDGADVMAIDFEVTHFGDPSFDAAFLLNHLALKSFYRPQDRAALGEAARAFWAAFRTDLPDWMEPATTAHLGGLMLARIDGKSPAEYITDEAMREDVRRFARRLMLAPPATLQEVFEQL